MNKGDYFYIKDQGIQEEEMAGHIASMVRKRAKNATTGLSFSFLFRVGFHPMVWYAHNYPSQAYSGTCFHGYFKFHQDDNQNSVSHKS